MLRTRLGVGVRYGAIAVLATGYWTLICVAGQVAEPWAATAYPLSLILSAAAGAIVRRGPWLAGPVIVFAQLPVMIFNGGIGPMIAIGVSLLAGLALLAAVASGLAGWASDRGS